MPSLISKEMVYNPEESRFEILRLLEKNPGVSQRELARLTGVSLGKINYLVKALLEKGLIKAGNFKRNPDKLYYMYLLTPQGLEEKARLTLSFLKRKTREYESLKQEIENLEKEVMALNVQESPSVRQIHG